MQNKGDIFDIYNKSGVQKDSHKSNSINYFIKQNENMTVNSNQLYIPPRSMELCQDQINVNPIKSILSNQTSLNNSDTMKSQNKYESNVLSKINFNEKRFHFKSTYEINKYKNDTLGLNTTTNNASSINSGLDSRQLQHSGTFTKNNPYVTNLPLRYNSQVDNTLDNSVQEYKQVQSKFDYHLDDFRNCSSIKQTESNNVNRQINKDESEDNVVPNHNPNSINETSSNSDNKTNNRKNLFLSRIPNKINRNLNIEKDSVIKNFKNKNKADESKKALDIREMLNNLLNELENNKNEINNKDEDKTGYFNTNLDSDNSQNGQITETVSRNYDKVYSKMLKNVSSSSLSSESSSSNCMMIQNIKSQLPLKKNCTKSKKSKKSVKINTPNISHKNCSAQVSEITNLYLNHKPKPIFAHSISLADFTELRFDSCTNYMIRAFNLDPFDDLIKSHLCPNDRRLKSISTKVDCTIKVVGPISINNIGINRPKIIYHCYLIGKSKDSVDKCLKCLQDSFPMMRLHEFNVPSSLYSH